MRRSINFLIGNGVLEADKDLFFGPILDTDEWFAFSDSDDWPEILVAAGLFSSRSQARKNGWNKPTPEGFGCYSFGKLRHELAVLRINNIQA